MEKKVIKINLVGAIAILVLIIALIIGLIIGIPKIIEKTKDFNGIIGNNKNQIQTSKIDESTEYYETVILKTGEERNCRLKYLKSSLGYAMKYDADLFYPEKNSSENNQLYSLYSNTVGIIITKEEGNFSELYSKIEEENQKIKDDNENDKKTEKILLTKEKLNEIDVIKNVRASNQNTENTYYIKIDESHYYIIFAYCSKPFEQEMLPIMEHMINSFIIL